MYRRSSDTLINSASGGSVVKYSGDSSPGSGLRAIGVHVGGSVVKSCVQPCSPDPDVVAEDGPPHERLRASCPPVRSRREHRQAEHLVSLRVEEAVVIDHAVRPHDPAPVEQVQRPRLAAADLRIEDPRPRRFALAISRCSRAKRTALKPSDRITTESAVR